MCLFMCIGQSCSLLSPTLQHRSLELSTARLEIQSESEFPANTAMPLPGVLLSFDRLFHFVVSTGIPQKCVKWWKQQLPLYGAADHAHSWTLHDIASCCIIKITETDWAGVFLYFQSAVYHLCIQALCFL